MSILDLYLVPAFFIFFFSIFLYVNPKEDLLKASMEGLKYAFLWPIILGILGFRWMNDRGWIDQVKTFLPIGIRKDDSSRVSEPSV